MGCVFFQKRWPIEKSGIDFKWTIIQIIHSPKFKVEPKNVCMFFVKRSIHFLFLKDPHFHVNPVQYVELFWRVCYNMLWIERPTSPTKIPRSYKFPINSPSLKKQPPLRTSLLSVLSLSNLEFFASLHGVLCLGFSFFVPDLTSLELFSLSHSIT